MSQSGDPRELARRLAEDAKAKALARKQADEAEARVAQQAEARALAAKEAEDAEHKALARRLVEEAKARFAAATPTASAPAPAPHQMAAPPRKLSALEAMRLAIDSENAAAAPPTLVASAATAPRVASSARPPAPPSVAADPRALIARRLPTFDCIEIRPVAHRDTFRALWTAHRVRAAAEGDARMLVTSDVLLDAAGRVAPGALYGARVRRDGQEHAIFLDAGDGVLLGITEQPDLYLAGL